MTLRLPPPHLAFLFAGATLGAALLVASPPFRWGDENTHFRQAYRLSEGDLRPACSTAGDNSTAPRGIIHLVYFTSLLHRKPRISWNELRALRTIEVRRDDRIPVRIERAPYTPLPYLPQAIAIDVASLGSRSALALYQAARIGNFLAWLGLTWLAIRLAPGLGWALTVLALAPMSVFLATVCSVDASANALGFLWTAYVLRLATEAEDERIGWRAVCQLVTLGVALTLTKFVYGLLLVMALLIPARRAGGRLRLVGLVGLLLASSGAALLGWLAYVGRDCLDAAAVTAPASVAAQWASLVAKPSYFLHLLHDTARSLWQYPTYGLVDTKWGAPFPTRTESRLFLGALVLAFVCDDRLPGRLSFARRAVALAVAVTGFVTIVGIAFVYWTRAGAMTIAGFQPRYLLPILPPLLVALELPRTTIPDGVRAVGVSTAVAITAVLLVRTIQRGLGIFTP